MRLINFKKSAFQIDQNRILKGDFNNVMYVSDIQIKENNVYLICTSAVQSTTLQKLFSLTNDVSDTARIFLTDKQSEKSVSTFGYYLRGQSIVIK